MNVGNQNDVIISEEHDFVTENHIHRDNFMYDNTSDFLLSSKPHHLLTKLFI